ncbi:MAG: YicC family protein, partial [Polyangiaceae bacterium]|nr:YicC family protein [Polyangiaceae bacterium]
GYGSGDAPLGSGRLFVEVRAVNHRFLDARIRMPSTLVDHTGLVEEILRRELSRGRVEASARLEGGALSAPRLDRDRAREAFFALAELRDELRPEEPVPLSLLAGVPGLFTEPTGPDAEEVRVAISAATSLACSALDAMRVREGAALASLLRAHLGELRRLAHEVQLRCPLVVTAHRAKLRERLERLLAEGGIRLDEGRLEHEVALFADKSDVTEEVERLLSHCDQFDELVEAGGSVGRKLDFLLQEMGREANTLGSKSSDVTLVRLVVDLKAEIERLREQVQNVY